MTFDNQGLGTVIFPEPFPNECIFIGMNDTGSSYPAIITLGNVDKEQATIRKLDSTADTDNMNFICIGY